MNLSNLYGVMGSRAGPLRIRGWRGVERGFGFKVYFQWMNRQIVGLLWNKEVEGTGLGVNPNSVFLDPSEFNWVGVLRLIDKNPVVRVC